MEDIEMQATVPKEAAQSPPEEVAQEHVTDAALPPKEAPSEAPEEARAEAPEEASAEAGTASTDAPPVGSEEWFARDREAFVAAHPDVSLSELLRDKRFELFAQGKVGNLPLSEIYEGYQALLATFDEEAKGLAAQMLANKLSSPGSLSGAGSPQGDYYSAEDVRRMSRREVSENYEKIRKSMARW